MRKKKQKNKVIKKFKGSNKLIVVGSGHYEDYKIIINTINHSNYKWIIAPHENDEKEMKYIKNKITKKSIKWSNLKDVENIDVLIIDKIGLLKHLYFYADIVYIGGGFTKGIHNSLEAAVFGKPLIFGPKYSEFQEAEYFVKHKIAFPINTENAFKSALKSNINISDLQKKTLKFFNQNKGNLQKIIDQVFD